MDTQHKDICTFIQYPIELDKTQEKTKKNLEGLKFFMINYVCFLVYR